MEDPTLKQVDAAEEGCELGSLQWSKLLAGPVDLWRKKPYWSRFAGRTWDPMLGQSAPEGLFPKEGTHTRAVDEELQPMKKFKDCLLWGGPHTGAGKAEILLQPMRKIMVRQAVPCSPWKFVVDYSRNPFLATMKGVRGGVHCNVKHDGLVQREQRWRL